MLRRSNIFESFDVHSENKVLKFYYEQQKVKLRLPFQTTTKWSQERRLYCTYDLELNQDK